MAETDRRQDEIQRLQAEKDGLDEWLNKQTDEILRLRAENEEQKHQLDIVYERVETLRANALTAGEAKWCLGLGVTSYAVPRPITDLAGKLQRIASEN